MFKSKTITGLILLAISAISQAQIKTYTNSGGEVIFSMGQLELTDSYKNVYRDADIENEPVRFTLFLHFGQFAHLDLSNNFGFYTGISMRNVGVISNEHLPATYTHNASPYNGNYKDIKVIRRMYSLGIPLAIKIGSFKDNFYVYGGGEIDYAFHYKQKYWESYSRDGSKTKTSDWFPTQLETFHPSAFVGVQLPKGINIKFKYYLENFLNHGYSKSYANHDNYGNDPDLQLREVVSDLTKYKESQMFYVSLSWFIKSSKQKRKEKPSEVAYY